ncbi:hypothetical protein A3709_18775 [Halioglobus sp. HI00S01]|uniref:hypothetical protein n=1 Tax=Halioglobus sp. HI00S01 TaxID=1822214 RepID=UPI0007C1FDFA|nr:hypothetical protein [Halioglobus sp. HI00S01]KZX57669.1 hypothetical protein A3709_18775 [Halioglobus sp. HI00S01]
MTYPRYFGHKQQPLLRIRILTVLAAISSMATLSSTNAQSSGIEIGSIEASEYPHTTLAVSLLEFKDALPEATKKGQCTMIGMVPDIMFRAAVTSKYNSRMKSEFGQEYELADPAGLLSGMLDGDTSDTTLIRCSVGNPEHGDIANTRWAALPAFKDTRLRDIAKAATRQEPDVIFTNFVFDQDTGKMQRIELVYGPPSSGTLSIASLESIYDRKWGEATSKYFRSAKSKQYDFQPWECSWRSSASPYQTAGQLVTIACRKPEPEFWLSLKDGRERAATQEAQRQFNLAVE